MGKITLDNGREFNTYSWTDATDWTTSRTVIAASACVTGTIDIGRFTFGEGKPFKCPNCGGNSYKYINGIQTCEYCETKFQ